MIMPALPTLLAASNTNTTFFCEMFCNQRPALGSVSLHQLADRHILFCGPHAPRIRRHAGKTSRSCRQRQQQQGISRAAAGAQCGHLSFCCSRVRPSSSSSRRSLPTYSSEPKLAARICKGEFICTTIRKRME